MPEITHRTWKNAMNDAAAAVEGQLVPALTHMQACQVQMRVGNGQLRDAARMIQIVGELGQEARQILATHAPRHDQVAEGQARAGGENEVAQRQQYNQR